MPPSRVIKTRHCPWQQFKAPSHITVWHGSDYTVVRATSYCYGEYHNWGCQNSETPKPTVTKFGLGDYVGDVTQLVKIQTTIFARIPRLNRGPILRGLIHSMSVLGYWCPRRQELTRRWDSEREPFYDDIAHVDLLQDTKKDNLFV